VAKYLNKNTDYKKLFISVFTELPELPPLPTGWKQTLSTADNAWVSTALFKFNKNTEKPELDRARNSIIFLIIVLETFLLLRNIGN